MRSCSIQNSIYAFRKTHTLSALSLRSFPSVASDTGPVLVWLTKALSRPFRGRSSSTFSSHASFLNAIGGDVLVPTGSVSVSPSLQIPRDAIATLGACWAHRSLSSVISLNSGMSRTVQVWLQETASGSVYKMCLKIQSRRSLFFGHFLALWISMFVTHFWHVRAIASRKLGQREELFWNGRCCLSAWISAFWARRKCVKWGIPLLICW